MALLGQRDTTNNVMLTGWDATELQNYSLEDGTTYTQVVGMLNAAISAFNNEIFGNPLWSGLVYYTDRPETKYRVGTSGNMERHTEYGRPDARRAETEGHMLPLQAWDDMLGWTFDYLNEEARVDDIMEDIAEAVNAATNRVRLQILTRLLQRGDDSGDNNGLGSSGLSPGFATAAASTGVDFTPPDYGGTPFTSAHEHYIGIAGGAFTTAVFTDARAELQEHGHFGNLQFIIGKSDETVVKGLTEFVPTASSTVNYGNDTSLAVQSADIDVATGSYYIGTIEDFNVRVVPGVPQYYGFGWKTYGSNVRQNPLHIRLKKGSSRPTLVAMPEPESRGIVPIQNLMTQIKFGVGVGNRTNGTARYVNNATWADGTPT